MKQLTVIIDGAALSDYSATGISERFKLARMRTHTPLGRAAESPACILTMLGVNENNIPRGRAYLEALALGLPISKNDMAVRINKVSIKNGRLTCAQGGEAFEEEDISLYENCFAYPVYHVKEYKNLAILASKADVCAQTLSFPPHENIGKEIKDIAPYSPDAQVQNFFDELLRCGYMPWGQAVYEELPSYYSLHKTKAAFVCATEIVRGIALAMDMYCPKISSATAECDTDLSAKALSAIELIQKYDDVYVHVNGADEAAHRFDKGEKLTFIARVYEQLVLPLVNNIKDECVLTVTSDHATLCERGDHSAEPVPEYEYIIKK